MVEPENRKTLEWAESQWITDTPKKTGKDIAYYYQQTLLLFFYISPLPISTDQS